MRGISSAAVLAAPAAPTNVLSAMQQLAGMDPICLTAAVDVLCRVVAASNPIVLLPIRCADGTAGLSELTLTPGTMITADAQGNVVTGTAPTVLAECVGEIDLTGKVVGFSDTVAFPAALPDAAYFLNFDYRSLAGLVKTTARTAAGFTYTVVSVVGGKIGYDAKAKGQAR